MFSVNQYRTPLINDLYDLVNFNTSIESLADDICEVCKAFYHQGREEAIAECIAFIKEHSTECFIDCEPYYGGLKNVVFNLDIWLDYLEELKDKKNE